METMIMQEKINSKKIHRTFYIVWVKGKTLFSGFLTFGTVTYVIALVVWRSNGHCASLAIMRSKTVRQSCVSGSTRDKHLALFF